MTSSRLTNNAPAGALALRLPERAFTRSGVVFRPNEPVWDWRDGPFKVHLDFARVSGQFAHLREPLKHALLVVAKGSSGSHLHNLFHAFMHFTSTRKSSTTFTTISVEEVANYSARLAPHERSRLGTLNALLQRWSTLGLPGVDEACAQYLGERRIPGNEKGAAVRTRDPVSGPFTEAEYTALYRAADAAYGKGEVPLWVLVLTRLLFACGGRIIQFASLKCADLSNGQGAYSLDLPQAKKREVHSRVSFKKFDLSPQTGRLAEELIASLGPDARSEGLALFPEKIVMATGPSQPSRPADDLFNSHCTAKTLSRCLRRHLEPIAPPSERLNHAATPTSPSRFRYTFGTRMVEEGASLVVVADRLGHTDLQNVHVYYEGSPKIVGNLDKGVGPLLVPLAMTFRGRLVEGEEDTTHKGAPGSKIIDFRVSKAPVGSCGGKGSACEFNKPVACYTCFKFEPWLDAPHEKVLQRLVDERKRFSNDARMAQVNDDAIRAVQEVIAECNQVREQRSTGAAS